MRFFTWLFVAMVLCASCLPQPAEGMEPGWRALYEDGKWDRDTTTWIGKGTESRRTPEGLLIADLSTEKGSGRFYMLNWGADPARGAVLEARVRVASCSGNSGVCLLVADGVHEDSLTLFPDRLELTDAKLSAAFDAAAEFHTYRMEIKGTDLRVSVDGELLLDASGRFTSLL